MIMVIRSNEDGVENDNVDFVNSFVTRMEMSVSEQDILREIRVC